MKVRVQIAAIATILAAACTSFVTPTLAAEYTLKWAVVTRGDMQEKFGHKLAFFRKPPTAASRSRFFPAASWAARQR